MESKIWTPEVVVENVPKTGIHKPRLFIRGGRFANTAAFMDVMSYHLPDTPHPDEEDGLSFVNFLRKMALRRDQVILAVIEATITIYPTTAIDALRDGLKMADDHSRLRQRVIPVVVFDKKRAHTLYPHPQSNIVNPNGPEEVKERAEKLGAITVPMTPETLVDRFGKVVAGIMKGQMPKLS